jgi:hypothetical protein
MASLDILTPVRLLLSMFRRGVDSLSIISQKAEENNDNDRQNNNETAEEEDFPMGSPLKKEQTAFPFDLPEVHNVSCFVMMLDMILAQISLPDATAHLGVFNDTCRDVMCLLTRMLQTPFGGKHTCEDDEATTHACTCCAMTTLWHQLASKCLKFVSPSPEITLPVRELPRVEEIQTRSKILEKLNGKKSLSIVK